MDLFGNDASQNLLPRDGIVNYHGVVWSPATADRHFKTLMEQTPWQHDETVIFGKRIVTARKVAWFAESGLAYTYSGTTKQPLEWTPELAEIKTRVEHLTGSTYNSCLLNLYHDGNEGMGWHSDDEKSLLTDATIASISLGAERIFRLKHKHLDLPQVEVVLEHGSLLAMKGSTQTHWLHTIPKTKKIKSPRINLTFRTMRT